MCIKIYSSGEREGELMVHTQTGSLSAHSLQSLPILLGYRASDWAPDGGMGMRRGIIIICQAVMMSCERIDIR